jgi:hypothetical protein
MDARGSNQDLNPSLDEVTRGSPRLEDELLAERLESAGTRWLRHGSAPSLADLLHSIPVLRSRPISLDTAIDIALRGFMARGLSLEAAAAEIRGDAPELGDAIDAHLALKSMMGSLPGTTYGDQTAWCDLPRPFGPPFKDGRHRYQLEDTIGSGTEGTVFRAMDRLLAADGRPLTVALKMLHGWRDGQERSVSEEAARAVRVRHPAIAALLDYGSCDGQPYLAYDFIDGAPLDRWRALQPNVSARTAARLVQQVAEAVQVAHNAGVVHRDLKPTNILLDKGGSPHVTDFGLAAAMRKGAGSEVVGSLGFAAPEQLRAEAGCEDALVDVYALGGLLYWLLTGRFPNGASPEEVHARIRGWGQLEAPDPHVERPELDRTLAAICRRALAPNPHLRYPSSAVLASDLGRWLAHEPVLPIDRPMTKRLRLWVRRSPAAAGGALAAGLAIVASLGIAWRADLSRRQAAFDREVELIKLQEAEQQRRIDDATGLFRSAMRAMRQLDPGSAGASWLPYLSVLESLGGEYELGLAGLNDEMNDLRIGVAKNVLAAAESSGTRDAVEVTMWETALGFWLLKAARAEEARVVLEENRVRTARVFPQHDPWLRNVDALCDVAAVMTDPDPEVIAAARQRLKDVMAALPENFAKLVSSTLEIPVAQNPR